MSVMSELHLELTQGDPRDRTIYFETPSPSEDKKIQYPKMNFKVLLRKRRLKEVLQKNPNRHQNIVDFCHSISATPQSANSFKHIYSMKRSNDEGPKLMLFYNQSVYLDMGLNSTTAKIGFDDIRAITFHKYLDWYITKNSFVGNIRRGEYLFSFDNIVIDVDNHVDDIEKIALNKQIRNLIECLNAKELDFPEFNVVYTGRGVQIWIGLVSFTARKESMKRLYLTFCEELCDIVKKVVEDNFICLQVDEAASKDMCRFVRLPYTTNTKANKKTMFRRFTNRRYTVDELCSRFNIQRADKSRKKEVVKSNKTRINYNMGLAPLFVKRMNFIEKIVENCNGNCVGRRELLLHHYFNICRQVFDYEEALEMTEKLNMQFSESLPSSTLSAISQEKIYKYKSQTFLSGINATFEEQQLYSNTTSRQSERDKAKKAKEERNKKIIELRENGYTQQRIADTVNCHVDTVSNVLNEYKWETVMSAKENKNRNSIKQKLMNLKLVKRRDVEKPTIELYRRGYKQKEIAQKLGIAESTVSNILKPYKKQVSPRDCKIIELSEQGFKQQQIADAVGCTRQTVSKVLKEHKERKTNVPEQVQEKTVASTIVQRIQLSTNEKVVDLSQTKFPKSFIQNLKSKEVEDYERNEINDDS